MDDMEIFRTTIEIQNLERGPRRALPGTMVDTGSEYTWIPRRVLEELGIRVQRQQAFEVADGRRIERDIGYALVCAGGTEAPDLVVFGEPGDMTLLGAHSLEGLNLKIDPIRQQLVPAGPVIAAAAALVFLHKILYRPSQPCHHRQHAVHVEPRAYACPRDRRGADADLSTQLLPGDAALLTLLVERRV